MLVSDAARQLGMSTQTLRLGLQQKLFPFGVAIKTSKKRYTYYINVEALQRYLDGEINTWYTENADRINSSNQEGVMDW